MQQGVEHGLAEAAAAVIWHWKAQHADKHLLLLHPGVEALLQFLDEFQHRQAEKVVHPHIGPRSEHLEGGLVRGQKAFQCGLPTCQQQSRHVRNQSARPRFHELQGFGEFLVREPQKRGIAVQGGDRLADALESEGIEVRPCGSIGTLGGEIEQSQIHPPSDVLVGIKGHALRAIRRHHAPDREAGFGRTNLGIGIHLNGEQRQTIYRYYGDAGVDARFRVVENRRLQLLRLGGVAVAWAGTGDAPVILYADEECATLAIGEADDILVKRTVVESLALLALEFDGKLLASGDQGFNFGFRHDVSFEVSIAACPGCAG